MSRSRRGKSVEFITAFDYFSNDFSNPDVRLEHAKRLIDQNRDPPRVRHEIHNPVAAHWGDSTLRLRQVFGYLSALGSLAQSYAGQSVMVFQKGAPKKWPSTEAYGLPLILETGILGGDLRHEFGGTLTDKGKPRRGVAPPYLSFRSSLGLEGSGQRLAIDIVGDPTVVDLPAPQLTTYLGTVSLRDKEAYNAARYTHQTKVAVGNDVVYYQVEQLVQDIPQPTPLLRFLELKREDQIGPDRPLPDLRLIFEDMLNTTEMDLARLSESV